MKKAILALGLCLSLAACEEAGQPQEVPKPKPSDNETASAGPYTVNFSGKDQSYTHSFNLSIKQEEGQVAYYIATPSSVEVEFVDTRLQVAGCPVSSVKHQIFWSQDASQPTVGQFITVGATFRTRAGMNGIFRHVVHGLGGCTSISLTTVLKVKPQLARACNGTLEPATCQVMAYCRQSGTSYYSEVEVWKETRGLVLRKFMNRGDGTRSLHIMADVTKLVQGNVTSYNDSYGDASLRIDGVTRSGLFTGSTSSDRLDCEL
jgi:hypothetical protein